GYEKALLGEIHLEEAHQRQQLSVEPRQHEVGLETGKSGDGLLEVLPPERPSGEQARLQVPSHVPGEAQPDRGAGRVDVDRREQTAMQVERVVGELLRPGRGRAKGWNRAGANGRNRSGGCGGGGGGG